MDIGMTHPPGRPLCSATRGALTATGRELVLAHNWLVAQIGTAPMPEGERVTLINGCVAETLGRLRALGNDRPEQENNR